VSVKWLTTAGLVCIVSANELAWSRLTWTSTHKLLITDVSHGAGTKCMRAYSRIVHIQLVLISEVDCHWNNINSDGTRRTSCIYAERDYNRRAYKWSRLYSKPACHERLHRHWMWSDQIANPNPSLNPDPPYLISSYLLPVWSFMTPLQTLTQSDPASISKVQCV